MSKKSIILLIALAVLVIGFMYYEKSGAPSANPQVTETPSAVSASNLPEVTAAEHEVVFSADGYSPKELTIKKGDTVTWVNNSNKETWPASAMHPTHKSYPGSDIAKCKTLAESIIFDACRGIKAGESWSFKFNEVGSWGYHDHLRASAFGKIIVTE